MDWRRGGGGGRPRGFGDSTWRGGGPEAAAPARPKAAAKPAMGATFGAKFKNPPAVAAAAPARPATHPMMNPPPPRPYSPVSGGTIPDIFLPKFGAKFGGKVSEKPVGKKVKSIPVPDIEDEPVREKENPSFLDTTPPISLDNESSSLYDLTDQTDDVSIPVSTVPDNYSQQGEQLPEPPPMSPPMFDEADDTDFPVANNDYEDEQDTQNKPMLLTQYDEEEEDYTEFVKQQETMMFQAQERLKQAQKAHRNPLVDDYDAGQTPPARRVAPFGDYIKNQESETETFYTPAASVDQALNKAGKRGQTKLGKESKPNRPLKTPEAKRDTPTGRRSARREDRTYEEDEFLTAFSEQSVRNSAIFIPQDVVESDQPMPFSSRERGWRDTKGRKEFSPLPFSHQAERGIRSKTPKIKDAKDDPAFTKRAKQKPVQGDESDHSLEEIAFEDSKAKGRQREYTDNKGRHSTSPPRVKGAMFESGGQEKGMKKAALREDESDDSGAKKKQMESQRSKKSRHADARFVEDSADEEKIEEKKTKTQMKGGMKATRKKPQSSEDERFSDEDLAKNTSPKLTKAGSQKTSSRSTTPSKTSKVHDEEDSRSGESDAAAMHKNKKGHKLYSTDDTKKPGKPPKQIEIDRNLSKSKGKPSRIKEDEFDEVNNDDRVESKKHSKNKAQSHKRSSSFSPKHPSSEDEMKEGAAGIQRKHKTRLQQQQPSRYVSSESQATEGDESRTAHKTKKVSRKQTAASRTPGPESDSAKMSTSASTDDARLKPKETPIDRSDDEKTDSGISAEESRVRRPRKRGKGKSRQDAHETATDSSLTSLTDDKMMKKNVRNKARDASSESRLSLDDEAVLSDDGKPGKTTNARKKKKPAVDSDYLAAEESKLDKRSRSKSPARKTPTGHLRPSTPDESDVDQGKKHGRKDSSAVLRQRAPGRKSVSDDSLGNVKQNAKQTRRGKEPDTSSFPSSDQTQTDLDEDDSQIASKSKAKKPSSKGTKGKFIEPILDEKGKDNKLKKSHGKKESKSSPQPVELKSNRISKDTSPRTASRDTKPSKQATLKSTAQDKKAKLKSMKVASKKKSEQESSETTDDKKEEKSTSESEEEIMEGRNESHDMKATDTKAKGRKKKGKSVSDVETELPVKDQPGEKDAGEISGSKTKHGKTLGEVENATHEMETQIEEKTFPPKKKATAVELQVSEASIFASQRPKPVGSMPAAVAQTTPSLSRKFIDNETGVQSEDFVNISKQRLPTASTAASHSQFSPKESLPQFRQSLRKFLSKDVQTPIAKRIQTTPSIAMSEESVTWEEYSANIVPKYEGKPSDRDKTRKKSVAIQQSVRKLGSDESTSIGTDVSESNVRHGWLDEVLQQLQSITEDKGQSSAEESSPDEHSQVEATEEDESYAGYRYHRAEGKHKFQYNPYSETSFDPHRLPTEESVFSTVPQAGSSIATVCPDPDKFVQVINISMLPSRIVAVEVTQDIGDGALPPVMPGKLEFDEPTTALTFNVPLMEPCQGDHQPVTDQHGKPWPQATTQRPMPITSRHTERSRKPSTVDRSTKSKDVGKRAASSRRQRGASTRHQRPVPVEETPRQQQHQDGSQQRGNQPSPADILLSRLAQRLAWKSQ